MKKIKIFLYLIGIIFLCSSCCSLNDQQLDTRKTGIIDACYTVLEYNPCDKQNRIQKYLNQKIKQNVIKQQQKIIIIKCLYRTQNSSCWKNKGNKK